jgi:hypothetical protein
MATRRRRREAVTSPELEVQNALRTRSELAYTPERHGALAQITFLGDAPLADDEQDHAMQLFDSWRGEHIERLRQGRAARGLPR